ncbi:uncharacterized protein [Dysidea avara]|uniref:uncharacterized protein n=1 Tax=Dysidea avara TaxID=196820 RepID=UPI003324F0F6
MNVEESGSATASSTTSSDLFDILFEYEGSIQPLSVSRENVIPSVEKELAKLGHDITVREVAIRDESKKRTAALQRWSTKWHRFVDTTGIEIADGDNVTIREHVCKAVATGEQQSKDEDYRSILDISTQDSGVDLNSILLQAEKDQKEFIQSLNTKLFFKPHDVNRSTILQDVFALFGIEEVLHHYPLKIHFVGEKAVDTGGVCHDMLAEFWQAAYVEYFEGSNLLVPSVNAQTDMTALHLIGTILSHGYIFCGVLPTRLAFPTLYASLVGVSVKLPRSILFGSFIDYLTTVEQNTVKRCLGIKSSAFSIDLQTQLIAILDRFGSRKVPKPNTLRQLLISAAEYEFLQKPLAAISCVNAGIPKQEVQFWSKYSADDLYTIFQCLTASPSKVLNLIEEPVLLNPREKKVFEYLQQFIGNTSTEDVGNFLQFVTGSSVCPTRKIQITFNSLSGYARRPVAHTCGFTLEISTDYSNYLQFSEEMKAVLTNKNSWSAITVANKADTLN